MYLFVCMYARMYVHVIIDNHVASLYICTHTNIETEGAEALILKVHVHTSIARLVYQQ
jgi:hypothetical protein